MSLMRSFHELILPRTCRVCGRRLAVDENIVCVSCLRHLPFTGFLDNPYDNEMAKMFWGRIRNFEKAFAMVYHLPHSLSARMVYQLKYFDKPELCEDVGEMMGKLMSEKNFFDGIDCILPVPLARKRLKERGYNQSEMIAEGLHGVCKLPIVKDAVRRVTFESSQTKKDRISRYENVDNAFELVNVEKLSGKHVLVVDDVVTTGATICAVVGLLEQVVDIRVSVVAIGFAGAWRANNAVDNYK